MEKVKTKIAVLLGCLLSTTLVGAQQFEDAATLEFGSFDVTPTLDIGLRFDDNLTKASSGEIDSWSRLVAPQISMVSSLGASDVRLAYKLVNEDFFSSSTDNYTDHFFVAGVDLELNARNRITTTLEFEDGHDARGSSFSIGLGAALETPDKYKQSDFDVLYSYGAFNADGRLDVNINIRELNYDIDTDSYLARDRVFSSLGGTFYYRIGATTDLTLDAQLTDVSYKFAIDPTNTLNSTNMSYLVGVKWEATAQTSGFAKVGYQEKDFDSALREDFDGIDWAAGVLWEPVDYASVEFVTGADTNETNGEGNFIRGRTHSISWRHDWLERLRSKVGVTWNNNRYEGELLDGFNIRSDDNLTFNAAMYYQFRRWFNVEAGYRFSERDSNRTEIDYNRNQFYINALITL
ncbi:MAG: outer membrane beta-barrel protein [Glaciecola sp.]